MRRRPNLAELGARALAIGWLLASCSGAAPPPVTPAPTPPPPPAPVEAPPEPPRLEDDPAPEGGAACEAGDACAEGEHCRGPAGCGTGWACGPARACGAETVSYCGCDNFTFYAQADCPGRPYLHAGPCEALGQLDEEEPEPVADHAMCTSDADCDSGFVCAGVAGCSTYWTCVRRVRMRPRCGRAQTRFCGCDGETFEAAAQCPGRPIAHAGYCDGDAPVVVAVAPPVTTPPVTAPPVTTPPVTTPPVTTPVVVAVAPPVTAPPGGETEPAHGSGVAGRRCRSSQECARGLVCQGVEGCGVDWHCSTPEERCIADTQRFCSCEGETFTASMTCPGRPHQHRGSCTAVD